MTLITCPMCCSPVIRNPNPRTYLCNNNHQFNEADLRRGHWVSVDYLAYDERHHHVTSQIAGEPMPLTYDQAARFAWAHGLRYEHQSDGTTLVWVEQCGTCT